MSGGHAHGHGAALSASGRHRWRLAVTFGLTATFMIVEVIAGLASGSVALLSDALHMGTDVLGLGMALVLNEDFPGRRILRVGDGGYQ